MFRLRCQGQIVDLAPGECFAKPRDLGFRDTPSEDLRALIAEIDAGRPWREAVAARYAATKPWLHRIIAESSRTHFLETVVPAATGPVLDIGSGWGQTARPLAATRKVVALEPVAERLGFIQAAARQDGVLANLACVEADYLEVDFESPFDLICTIGVLEWVGAFQSQSDAQQRQRDFLAKTRRELSPNGALVIGIENRLGLKYLLGCPDDHLGAPHIACLPAPLAIARWHDTTGHTLRSFTYSVSELGRLLTQAGFRRVEMFAAFPDYKVPTHIVPFGEGGKTVNDWLLGQNVPSEHNGYDGTPLVDAEQAALSQHYRTLAAQGVAHQFVPSFFVRAS